ncbi:MAG: PSD1 and planctomycete cytochrome C domain-containing protein [Gemmataceae bacterium]|nr:PSD1 and planctomycete cytochrome C domain-containing protein [Gemmataceae bacterium]
MLRSWMLVGVMSFSAAAAQGQTTGKIQYARDVQPILSANCFACHGFDEAARKAKLRLDTPEGAAMKLRSGAKAVVAGKPDESELIARILSEGDDRMPPVKAHPPLTDRERKVLRQWIAEGAEYQRHWAFIQPKKSPIPVTKNKTWARNPIDAFVLARIEKEGMQPSAEADRYTLARRVALDLTGLPPKLELVDRFVADTSPDAYEKYVDEVMKSPAYGERWAQVWLDLARYADSNGYAEDQPRTIWKYREWVIDAFNANQPFDQFTLEQIAGDMLPNANVKQLLATAFHRNTLTNTEGGTNDEEFRVIAVVDRVNTTMQTWMGITIGCCECHDHKYDPISQEEFYRLFAIFNQSEDSDKGDNSPNLMYLSPEDEARKKSLEAEASGIEKEIAKLAPTLDADQAKWEKSVEVGKLPKNIQATLAVDAAKRQPKQKEELINFYRGTRPEIKAAADKLTAAKTQLAAIKPVPTPIMRELGEKQRRTTKIHNRGNWLDLGKKVEPGVPAMFHSLKKEDSANRFALAHWLVSPENPLTSRVTVNRFWEQIFGNYLVDTPEDFGMRCKIPMHVELLDWLAADFAGEGKWDVKRLLKMMVTSAAYRQSSKTTAEALEKDPNNFLYARGPRFRSQAETVRDQALAVAGLLSPKVGGPSVYPPQPKLGLSAAFGPGTDWTTSSGEDKYRRGVYTSWRRTIPYPSMTTFDAPNRTVCAVKRPRSNTPLQALVTLNDPVFVEAAQALARRMVKEGGDTPESRIRMAFRLTLVRPPQEGELRRLVTLYQSARAEYAKNAKEAAIFATDPIGPLPAGMDAADLAAYTLVGNVVLNLDETFAKP